jgi:hypothetical protein
MEVNEEILKQFLKIGQKIQKDVDTILEKHKEETQSSDKEE